MVACGREGTLFFWRDVNRKRKNNRPSLPSLTFASHQPEKNGATHATHTHSCILLSHPRDLTTAPLPRHTPRTRTHKKGPPRPTNHSPMCKLVKGVLSLLTAAGAAAVVVITATKV